MKFLKILVALSMIILINFPYSSDSLEIKNSKIEIIDEKISLNIEFNKPITCSLILKELDIDFYKDNEFKINCHQINDYLIKLWFSKVMYI